MIKLYAEKNRLRLRSGELLTSGSVNVNQVETGFSPHWDGMDKTAVFRCGSVSVSVSLDQSGRCAIPHEVLEEPGRTLYMGVEGAGGGEVLPTVWASLGVVQEGVLLGGEARPPTPELWRQELAKKQDKLSGQPGQVVGFDEEGKAIAQENAGGSGGAGYRFGHGLKTSGNLVSVDAVDGFAGDKTLPITAAAVERTVGNIAILLSTI